jgi:hypothetical protein
MNRTFSPWFIPIPNRVNEASKDKIKTTKAMVKLLDYFSAT